MATLQMGSQGPAVSALQAELNQALGPADHIAVDGDFGPRTRAAVEQFQRDHGLVVDGVVGPQTSAALAAATKGHGKKPHPGPHHGVTGGGGGSSGGASPGGGGHGGGSHGGPVPDEVTLAQLHAIMPDLTAAHGHLYIAPLNRAMKEFFITTYLRKAAFLAQLAEESGELQWFEELASGWEYDISQNRSLALELGNTQVGDGPRYKGRGPIQLTGKNNYIAAGRALGLDLVDHPDMAAQPNVGFRVAGWYWVGHGLNALADVRDFEEITLRINGGLNGYSVRLQYYERALHVLG
jgi:putative chitinase